MLTVNEEETSVMICVSLSPSLLEATVIVGLQAQSDSATGIKINELTFLHIIISLVWIFV